MTATPTPVSTAPQLDSALRVMFDTFDDVVVLADDAGFIREINDAGGRQLGYAREELLGMSLSHIVARPDFDIGVLHRQLAKTPRLTFSSLHRRKDGSVYPVEVRLTRMDTLDRWYVLGITRDLTQLRAAEQSLAQSEQRYRALVENFPGAAMILYDRDLRFVLVDGPEVQATGFSREAMMGRTLREAMPPEFAALVEPNMRRALAGERFGMDLPFGDRWYRYNYLPLPGPDGAVELGFILAQNITAEVRARAEIQAREEEYRALATNIPDLVVRYDREGRLLYANPAVAQAVGRTTAELREREAAVRAGADVERWLARVREVAETGEPLRAEETTTWTAATRTWDSHFVPERGQSGLVETVLVISRDITELKQRERELEEKNDELVRFAYTVSHDLKSPLVTIQSFVGYLGLDLESGDRARVSRDLDYIRTAADRMAQLLSDLLQLSRIGRIVGTAESIPFAPLVREAATLVAGRTARVGATITLPEGDATVWGDRQRLLEVFQNLLDNAVKFSAGVPAPHVEVGLEPSPDGPVIYVRDNGIGVDPRHQHKLFGLFEKLRADAEGTGIGLALVKRIIDVHGGAVWFESAGEGHGSVVRLRLPRTSA